MNGDKLFPIGELARRTGLPVRTIRFYSDEGVLPPTDRTYAGHRLYDLDALARLGLIRTLRELGVDLPMVRRVLHREISVPQVAAAHAEALEVQVRVLRLRQAVLRLVAERGSSPEELEFMHKLTKLSDVERRRIIHGFIDDTFGEVDANPEFVAMLRAAMPDLPAEPTVEQVDAWIELAELVQDPDFKAAVRRAAEHQAAERAEGDRTGLHHDLTVLVIDRVTAARDAGVAPDSPAAGAVVDELMARYAETFDKADSREYRAKVLTRLEVGNDPRTWRYWGLIATINDTPQPPELAPVFDWFITALTAHPAPGR